jgi:1-aminocyclopropane-1-carboxylate deaminase/D-cysteine desulfhydrase-like pyridoxal-dependent ACC family enzyme
MTSFAQVFTQSQGVAPVVYLHDPRIQRHGVTLAVKREDLLHPLVSGNKWRKLKYNLFHARAEGHDTLLSFGGAYSNHLHALASAGRLWDFTTIGVVRGEPWAAQNPTLSHARQCGMRLHFVGREEYRRRHDLNWQAALRERYGHCYLIPEGGSNRLALEGVGEIWEELTEPFDFVATAAGTGATAAGLMARAPLATTVLAFAVLKGAGFLRRDIEKWLAGVSGERRWRLLEAYHGGGYARLTPELVRFMDDFERRHGIALDPVYTGKMMYGLYDLVERGEIPAGSRVLALHTGGLQGRAGMAGAMARMRLEGEGRQGREDA